MQARAKLALMITGFAIPATAQSPNGPGVDFYADIRPIFAANCAGCHQGRGAPAELRLDSPEGVLQGGTSGKVILPGNADKSLLVERIEDVGTNRMPPGGQLSVRQINLIKTWIDQGAKADPSVDFATQVQPVFKVSCYSCHSGNDPKSKLHLDDRSLALKGAATGPVIIPGSSDRSRIVKRVLGEGGEPRMPLVGTALSEAQIAVLKKWIDQGANWPDAAAKTTHWAYVKPARPPVPEVNQKGWIRNPIDSFILARLEKEGLRPSPEASKEKLVRRLYLDLIGLPPSPADVDDFVNDRRSDAYDRLVDKLLGSPRFGERWARPWLDLARYADSDGYEKDRLRSMWPYRDWVMKAINQNMPFYQFTIEQLAGDLLPNATTDQKVATGFLRNSMINTEGGVDPEESNWNEQLDRAITVGTTWLGSTTGCAECHNHKFDPFTQKQFYQMVAFFNNAAFDKAPRTSAFGGYAVPAFREAQLELPTPEQARQRDDILAERKQYESQLNETTPAFLQQLAGWEREIQNFEAQWQPLRATRLESTAGSKLISSADDSILATGPQTKTDTYTLEARAPAGEITAFKLEALLDPSLPRSGPGRDFYGNFFVGAVDIEVRSPGQQFAPVTIRETLRDDPAPGLNKIAFAPKDLKYKVNEYVVPLWALDATRDDNRVTHQLLLLPEKPLKVEPGSTFRITIVQNSGVLGQALGRFRVSVTAAGEPKRLADVPSRIRTLLNIAGDKRTDKQREQLIAHYRSVAVELAPVRAKLAELDRRVAALGIPTTYVVAENPEVKHPSTFMRITGAFASRSDQVEADVPSFLGSLPSDAPPNRLGLAKWLVSPANPLTARVRINQIWQTIFGTGIVESSEDFGSQGIAPSHPELLDWLATEFVSKGWDQKAMIRMMVTSNAYRQSSVATPGLLERDPANKLLARGSRYRVEAEMVRDVALSASGLLSAKVGGPSVMPYQPDGVWDLPLGGNVDVWRLSSGEDRYRRGLYTVIRRTANYPSMSMFDAPSREFCTVRRVRSDTPLQALTTLNDPVFVEAAQALAKRIIAEGGTDPSARANYGYRLVTSARPEGQKLDSLMTAYAGERRYFELHLDEAKTLTGQTDVELAAWTTLARVLLNLDATLTRD